MRKKTKPTANSTSHGAVEMIIRINNENVEVELLPPVKAEEEVKMIQQKEMIDTFSSNNDQIEVDTLVEEKNVEKMVGIEESPQHNFEDSNASNVSSSSDEKIRAPALGSLSPTSLEDRKMVHNKSEKHRRAQLKASMDKLKLLVPLEDSTQKYTTAALLRKARYLIQKLEERERRNIVFKEQLQREQKYLRKRLDQIQQLQKDGFGGNTVYMSNPTPSTSHHHSNPNRPQSFPLQGISGGGISGTSTKLPKYPVASTSSQVQVQPKTPPILKRKQNLEPDLHENTEIIFIETPNSELNHPATSSTATTYELIATNSNEHFSISTNGLAPENYCIIIDTDMIQEDYHPVTISNSTPSD